ncbi:HipA domain-containing protein [Flagellimonas oceanensis]|uniref:HipA domain-containing protein n=1 Tax=Flagellimonas oceanensis TaxID=2499163 RepID=UPI000F8D331C|nr:HipA domain-containing protein [Allomuricauda oceanensis]
MKKKLDQSDNFIHLKPLPILGKSGYQHGMSGLLVAKKHSYSVIKDVAVGGDAPKDLIRLYEYGCGRKTNFNGWPIYIAKLGHKWYPCESITEQLISDIGRWLGFLLADSKLCVLGGQIRFLSKYFLSRNKEQLYHGANLYAGYLNDEQFVDEVELAQQTQSFFTVNFTKETLSHFFEDTKEELFARFMEMLFFDALVGNNDRHMYNWGVIRDLFGIKNAKYAPIYDSARGLLWNYTEKKIDNILNSGQTKLSIESYCNASRPKIGVEGKSKINHFTLIEVHKEYFKTLDLVKNSLKPEVLDQVLENIDKNYKTLLSNNRRLLIKDILRYRVEVIRNTLI